MDLETLRCSAREGDDDDDDDAGEGADLEDEVSDDGKSFLISDQALDHCGLLILGRQFRFSLLWGPVQP